MAKSYVTSDEPPQYLISDKEGSSIFHDTTHQIHMSKNNGHASSYCKQPPLPNSKSDESDASSDNGSRFLNEKTQESRTPSVVLSQVVAKMPQQFIANDAPSNNSSRCLPTDNEGSIFSTKKTRQFLRNKNEVSNSSYKPSPLHISRSEGFDTSPERCQLSEKEQDSTAATAFLTQLCRNKQVSEVQANKQVRFFPNKSIGSDVPSDKPPRCPASQGEDSSISYDKRRQLLTSKNKGPNSSSYNQSPFTISKSDGTDASSENQYQFFNEATQESITPSAFLEQAVYGNKGELDFQTDTTHRYLINNSEGLGIHPNEAPLLPIGMGKTSDASSNDQSPFYNNKKKGANFQTVCPSRPTNKNKRGSKAKLNIPPRFAVSKGEKSDALSDYHSKPFIKNMSRDTSQGSNRGDESFRFVARKNRGLNPDGKPPRFVSSGNQRPDPHTDHETVYPSQPTNKNRKCSKVGFNIPPELMFSSREERGAPSDYHPQSFIKNLSHSTHQESNSNDEASQFVASRNEKSDPDDRTVYSSQPVNKNRKLSKAKCNISPRFIVRNRKKPKALSNHHSLPFIKSIPCSTSQRSNSGNETSRLIVSRNGGSNADNVSSLFVAGGNEVLNSSQEPSQFIVSGNQESNLQFGGQSSLITNKNNAENAEQPEFMVNKNLASNQGSEHYLNIFVAGPENCGKIQLIKAFVGTRVEIVKSKIYNSSCVAIGTDEKTGVDFKIWYVRNLRLSLQFVRKICSSEKSAILLVYNVIQHQTLSDIDDHIKDVKSILGGKIPIVLVGNKIDARTDITISEFAKASMPVNLFVDGHKRKVKYDLQDFFECSGKTCVGVLEVFQRALQCAK